MQNLKFDIPVWDGYVAAKLELSDTINGFGECFLVDNETFCIIDYSLNLFFLSFSSKKSKLKCPSFGEQGKAFWNFKISFERLFKYLYGRDLTSDERKEYYQKCSSPMKKVLPILYLGDYQFFIQPLERVNCRVFSLIETENSLICLNRKIKNAYSMKMYSKTKILFTDEIGRIFLWDWALNKIKLLLNKAPFMPLQVLKFSNNLLLILMTSSSYHNQKFKTFFLDPITKKIHYEEIISDSINNPKSVYNKEKNEYLLYYCGEEDKYGSVYLSIKHYYAYENSKFIKEYKILIPEEESINPNDLDENNVNISFIDQNTIMIHFSEAMRVSFYKLLDKQLLFIFTARLLKSDDHFSYSKKFFSDIVQLRENYFIFHQMTNGNSSGIYLASFAFLDRLEKFKPNKTFTPFQKTYDGIEESYDIRDPEVCFYTKPLIPNPTSNIKFTVSEGNNLYIMNCQGRILKYDFQTSKLDDLFRVSIELCDEVRSIHYFSSKLILNMFYKSRHLNESLLIVDLGNNKKVEKIKELYYDGSFLFLHNKLGPIILEEGGDDTWISIVDFKNNKLNKHVQILSDIQDGDSDQESELTEFIYLEMCCQLTEDLFAGITVNARIQIYDLLNKTLVRTKKFNENYFDDGDEDDEDEFDFHGITADFMKLISPDLLAITITNHDSYFVLYNWRQNQIVFVRSMLEGYCKGMLNNSLLFKVVDEQEHYLIELDGCLDIIKNHPDQALLPDEIIEYKLLKGNDFKANTIEAINKRLSVMEDFDNLAGNIFFVKPIRKKLIALSLLHKELKDNYDKNVIKLVSEMI